MTDEAHRLTDKEIERMERHLSEIYARAEKELTEKAEKYFAQFQKLDEKKRALVDAGKMTEREYQRWRRGKLMTGKHWTELKEQAAQELLNANRTAQAYINGQLPKIYSINYNGVGEAVESAVSGYSFELVDAATVKRLATTDKTLLPYKIVDGKKDVRWNTQKVNSEIMQGIIQGESIPKMAKRLQNVTEMNRVSAIRNARTSATSAENKGRMDSLHAAAEKGVITHKVWMAAIDARTREAHRLLDGQEQEIDDPFESELGDIMYPGDPDADPANVYNCRCTLTYKVVGFGNRTVTEEAESETAGEFIPATSIKDAEEYARSFGIDADYSAFDLSVANEVNRIVSQIRSTFGEESLSALKRVGTFPKGFSTKWKGVYSVKDQALYLRNVRGKSLKSMAKLCSEQHSSGWWSTGSEYHVIRHELGHAIEASAGWGEEVTISVNKYFKQVKQEKLRSRGKMLSSDYLSEYGFTNVHEFIAESVAEYLSGNPRETAIKVVEILRGAIK